MSRTKEPGKEKLAKSQEYVDSSADGSDTDSGSQEKGRDESRGPTSSSKSRTDIDSESSSQTGESSTAEESSSSESEGSRGVKRASKSSNSVSEPLRKKSKTSNSAVAGGIDKSLPEPPPGYKPLTTNASDSISEVGSIFSNLKGKQVWHITAPASVPIASIQSLDISAALRGDPILHHKGTSYSMVLAPSKDDNLLLPSTSTRTYSKAKIEVSRSLLLRESGHQLKAEQSNESVHPNRTPAEDKVESDSRSIEFFAVDEGNSKKTREQPKGLLMRYQPYGSENTERKPYRLLHPDDEGDQESSTSGAKLIVSILDDDGTKDATVTPKAAHHKKKSKKSQPTSERADEDIMEIDDAPSHSRETPLSNIRSGQSQTDSSRKKKKKERKEKV